MEGMRRIHCSLFLLSLGIRCQLFNCVEKKINDLASSDSRNFRVLPVCTTHLAGVSRFSVLSELTYLHQIGIAGVGRINLDVS